MQGMSPDDQILNQFARNQKMHIWKKYKTEILQILSWQIQEYLNWDSAVRERRPCRHVSWFWFLPEEVGRVHAHPWLQVQVHDHHHHHLPKWPLLSPGWDSERGDYLFKLSCYTLGPLCLWQCFLQVVLVLVVRAAWEKVGKLNLVNVSCMWAEVVQVVCISVFQMNLNLCLTLWTVQVLCFMLYFVFFILYMRWFEFDLDLHL